MGSVAAKFYICRNRYFQLPPKYTYIGIGSLNEDTTSSATCRQVVELGRLWQKNSELMQCKQLQAKAMGRYLVLVSRGNGNDK